MNWIKIFPHLDAALGRLQDKKPQLVVIGELKICLIKNGRDFYAIQDSCSHNGESLSKGHLNYLGEIICPWHNYCFNVKSGQELNNRSTALKTYPVKIDDTGFFIGI
jgi:nitrite reductase/ring-hydroxylating ferredoxin subunit